MNLLVNETKCSAHGLMLSTQWWCNILYKRVSQTPRRGRDATCSDLRAWTRNVSGCSADSCISAASCGGSSDFDSSRPRLRTTAVSGRRQERAQQCTRQRGHCARAGRTLYPMGIASVSWVVGSLEPVKRHVERRVVGELARGWVESESVPTVILDIHNHLIENLREFWLAK